ncbi:ATP-dependent zinc metalloprotease FtsH [Candidatus Babeliales bacterium]|nr:ATP-dependent zinc metalloprotease FtsH [Candidatus Babeliales bacterium]
MKKKQNKFGKLPSGPANIIIFVLLLLGGIFMLSKIADNVKETGEIPYSEYLNLVEQDKIKKINVIGTFVSGVTKDEKSFETNVAEYPGHWDLLRKHNVEFAIINQSNQFSMWHILFIILLIAGFAVMWYFFKPSSNTGSGGGGNIFTMGKSKAKMFLPSAIKEKFSSVAGAHEAKEELEDMVDFLKNPEKYKRLGAKITRGALLVGEPGNGKTLLARAVAGEANCPFFSISGSDFIEVFVGVGASRVRDLFAQARKHAPSIIFIDEIDAVGRHRSAGGVGGGNDEREQTLNQLLTEMDGFEVGKDPVIVLAATNRPDVLDKALLRPGRFDRRVEVPYPDLASRVQILTLHAQTVQISDDVDMKKIARGTPGFSGADLANLINEATIIASKGNKEKVTIQDFEEARDKILLGKEIKTIVLTQKDREITAYHEAGHALVRLMMPNVMDPLHKVTIVPRGRALGVTHSMPEREKYNRNKEEMIASIKAALGGRVAEEIVFNELSTGAYSDFLTATDIVRDIVCRYGMTDELGPIVYSQKQGDFVYSQKTAEKIDEKVRQIIDTCYAETKDLLMAHKDKLTALSVALLDKETMYAREIYELLNIESREDHKFE